MEEQDPQKKEKQPEIQINMDDISLETQNYYSGFGRMIPSKKPTAPKYGFGSATRNGQQKVYQSKHLVKQQFIGKTSAGIRKGYNHQEGENKFKYKGDPAWVFGKNQRNTLDIKQKYSHYSSDHDDLQALDADGQRRWKTGRTVFGTSKRFNLPKADKATPGPKYNPPKRQNFKRPPKFSFGVRREIPGQSPIAPLISTGRNVGPGKYFGKNEHRNRKKNMGKPLNMPRDSRHKSYPKHRFPQDMRFKNRVPRHETYETYENYRSCGKQQRSKMKTEPKVGLTKANRDTKTGMFKDMMATKPLRVRIAHPRI